MPGKAFWRRAKKILSRPSVIAMREKLVGQALLDALGISPAWSFVTGDDAVELAYRKRSPETGGGIGLNLRVSPYSGLDRDDIDSVRSALFTAAGTLRAPSYPYRFHFTPMMAMTKIWGNYWPGMMRFHMAARGPSAFRRWIRKIIPHPVRDQLRRFFT